MRTNEPYRFVTSKEFAKTYESFHVGRKIASEVATQYDKRKSHPATLTNNKCGLGKRELLKACMDREILLMKEKFISINIINLFQETLPLDSIDPFQLNLNVADIASCVKASRGLKRQSAESISVDTQGCSVHNEGFPEVSAFRVGWNKVNKNKFDDQSAFENLIMEYLVKISKKPRILELKRRNMKKTDSDIQYAVSIKEDTAYMCLHFTKYHEVNKINTPYSENPIRRIQVIECEDSGRYQTWSGSWDVSWKKTEEYTKI
ncbi:hypothetical protein Tco_0461741 [Tanacetum coccineum]